MPKCYLLPCSNCKNELEVEARQAGSDLNCPECDAAVAVPTFRDLKNLKQKGDEPSGGEKQPHPLKGIFFAAGLGLAVLFGGAGWMLYNYSSTLIADTTFDRQEQADWLNEPIESATPSELWQIWQTSVESSQLPDWSESTWNRYNKQGKILLNISYGVLGIGVLGLLAMLISFFLPNRTVAA